jgi:uncharacterized membrane protein (Fun14 family)
MEIGIAASGLGGGFFAGLLIGYAIKKVAKIIGLILGLFLAGLAYLQHQGIVNVKWDQLENVTQGAANIIVNATENGIPGIVTQQGFESWGSSLTGGIALGFAIGFVKG